MTQSEIQRMVDAITVEIDSIQSRPFRRVAKLRPRPAVRAAARHHVSAWLNQFVMLVVRT